jgi:hypothetical protein
MTHAHARRLRAAALTASVVLAGLGVTSPALSSGRVVASATLANLTGDKIRYGTLVSTPPGNDGAWVRKPNRVPRSLNNNAYASWSIESTRDDAIGFVATLVILKADGSDGVYVRLASSASTRRDPSASCTLQNVVGGDTPKRWECVTERPTIVRGRERIFRYVVRPKRG